ncbi:MAG: MFS transporter [Desulfobacterales bacterium]
MMHAAVSKKGRHTPVFFYGWIIVLVAFVTLGIAFGVWYSFSVFILAIIREFEWSRAAASSIFSLFILSHAIMGFAAGHLQDRFGPRAVIPAGAFFLALALVLTSRAQSLWHFQAAYGLMAGSAMSFLGFVSHSVFIPRWFERKRGLALGIAMAGIGFGMLLMVPFAERLITAFGWRSAYRYLAGIVLFIVLPINIILTRRGPEDVHQIPDGFPPTEEQSAGKPKRELVIVDEAWANVEWDLQKAWRTRRFWILCATFFAVAFANQSVLLHAVSAMVDSGMERKMAAYFFGIAGISGSAGKICFGYLSDILGRERTKLIADVVAVAGIGALLAVSMVKGPMPLLFGLLFGMGYGAVAPLIPAVTADIFLGRNFGKIFAVIAVGGGIGGATGAYVSGLLRDLSGSYALPFTTCIFLIFMSCILIFAAGPGKIRKPVKKLPS